ncbi:hypothetical protein [Amnibacterium kyonggiense]|uniref:Uncharacterized protein n=1 Tax=Amnibacterium kyonggiense TaxID=595671 RepID=A0A4R7FM75_9MICO|nr:hypothetical protein [Amnibacterium kyonggiense]TDS77551.1 hypothetical protein CLV52_2505 [Amnibacterium kyonggiense]
MADDRSNTGSAAPEASVHDDDELAEVLAAELERYSTGTVPVLPRVSAPAPTEDPIQPLAVPRIEPAATVDEGAFARRAAEVERTIREVQTAPVRAQATVDTAATAGPFRRADRPTGRRSATGPIMQPTALPTADDLPVKRRTGFRPPPSAVPLPPVEPLDRVLPATGPVSLPEPTASLLDEMITGAIPVIDTPTQRTARHAAPDVDAGPWAAEPVAETAPQAAVPPPAAPAPLPAPPAPAPAIALPVWSEPAAARPASTTPPAGELETAPWAAPAGASDGFYEDWEQSLRAIGRPRPPWEVDDEQIVPTGGDPDVATVAVRIQPTGPVPSAPPIPEAASRGAHALPADAAPVELPEQPEARPRRSGRRRAAVPEDALPQPPAAPASAPVASAPAPIVEPDAPTGEVLPSAPQPFQQLQAERADSVLGTDDDAEGIDEVAVDYPVVSAATTGAVDLPQVEPRPRTAPVLIERVRTALLQLPTVPPSPTGSGAGAIVGRWIGAFTSPVVLVLAFGLAAAGAGPAAAVAVVAGALLAVPALIRTAGWSARATDDGAMHETAVLGGAAGRGVAIALLLARLGAAATVLFAAGSAAGAWADRTGALGLGASNAALLGCTGVGLLAILCAALPVRATAALALLAAVGGAVGTLLIALVLAPNGGPPIATTASGAVAGAAAGFAGIGLLLVLCGADVARWRTDLAHPVATAVASIVAVVCGAAILAGGTVIASRLSGGGDALDEFAGALSDASASLLAAPMLVILLVAGITLPALLVRSSGAAAARLLGAGRPVRLGAVASGLLALAVALGLLAGGVDPTADVLAVAALCGAPVAAWAGALTATRGALRPAVTTAGLVVATVLGWALSDGVLPGVRSPLLAALPSSSGLHGGPALGLLAALVVGALAGLLGGSATTIGRSAARPADTVEG